MKKKNVILKMIVVSAVLVIAVAATGLAVIGAENEITVSVRIEGISENILNDTFNVPSEDGVTTVADVMTHVDSMRDDITIEGVQDNFISAINDDSQGTFGGWDGWSYMVNGEQPAVGIDEAQVSENDIIVFFYGDMETQVPMADTQNINRGVIKFTSEDTTYDEDWNPTVSVNPVEGATVTFDGNEYTTDENGEIQIPVESIASGTYSLQIEKYDSQEVDGKFLPLVLRFAPDYEVEILVETDSPGDAGTIILYAAIVLVAVIAIVIVLKKTRK